MNKKVWIDTDVAIGAPDRRGGVADVDDAFAILHLLKSKDATVRGISTVFGNTFIEEATDIARHISQEFGPRPLIPVFRGAENALDLANIQHNPATLAMKEALEKEKLIIMAIGPASNIGILLLLEPHLAEQIESIALVAGRQSIQDHFKVGPEHDPPFPDLNFDLDPEAFRILVHAGVTLALLPFEVSHKVWFTREDLDDLATGGSAAQYLSRHSIPWLEQWKPFQTPGFNPFDVMASAWILRPELFESEMLYPSFPIAKDDTSPESNSFKPYFVLKKDFNHHLPIRYCHTPKPELKSWILGQLKDGNDSPAL